MGILEKLSTMAMVKTVGATIEVASTEKLLNHQHTVLVAGLEIEDLSCAGPLGELLEKINAELFKRGVTTEDGKLIE